MPGRRLDAIVGREAKDGKKFWTKIGVAFERDNGGFSVMLDALPVGGQFMLVLPREERQQGAGGGDRGNFARGGQSRGGGRPQHTYRKASAPQQQAGQDDFDFPGVETNGNPEDDFG